VLRLTEIKLDLDHPEAALKTAILRALGISEPELLGYHVRRRGYDARKSGQVVFVYTLDAEVKDEPALLARFRHSQHIRKAPDETYYYPVQAPANFGKRPVVIGTGPCGLFAGLSLARMGFKPLILERGKEVRERSQDVWGFWRQGRFNPESNVQFGEGGAGTFSDGKLHRHQDRGHHIKMILQDFVDAGAPEEILYISKPHIGTLRLVKVVENLRRRIVELGGEIRFGSHVTDIVIEDGDVQGRTSAAGGRMPGAAAVRGVTLANGESIDTDHVILALGHSARDTFEMLHRRGVHMEAKPFSIGFRIEHPQMLINRCRLGSESAHPVLGAAYYKLVQHCKNVRSVYSFCMCPGGQVSRRHRRKDALCQRHEPLLAQQTQRQRRHRRRHYATGFRSDDPLAGMALQRKLEEKAFELGGKNYHARPSASAISRRDLRPGRVRLFLLILPA
jgi:uncharacterized FAD-dependent dehydrogenase